MTACWPLIDIVQEDVGSGLSIRFAAETPLQTPASVERLMVGVTPRYSPGTSRSCA